MLLFFVKSSNLTIFDYLKMKHLIFYNLQLESMMQHLNKENSTEYKRFGN